MRKSALIFTIILAATQAASGGSLASHSISLASRVTRPSQSFPAQTFSAVPINDEFEGKFKVGTTTCTVKPIKMAFEVKWAKGKGTLVFFFKEELPDGKVIYVSEDKPDGVDQFIFDNNRHRSGTFRRADGKEFSVSKLS